MQSDKPMMETGGSREVPESAFNQGLRISSATRAVLLPIKDLNSAKQRLAGILTAEERFRLAQAMLADTVKAMHGIQRAGQIFVITNYEPAMEIASKYGWEIVREEKQTSESASVDFASRVCMERGITALLRLPLDLPLVKADDIDDLLATECAAPGVVMVPSRDGSGTNAILRRPPALFPSHFGPDSFLKHRKEAERVGAMIVIKRNPRLELDVDDEADLRALLRHDLTHTSTGKWLEESGIAARFRRSARGV